MEGVSFVLMDFLFPSEQFPAFSLLNFDTSLKRGNFNANQNQILL
jgi:hypothetical protein